jgi:hypothetical protein
MQDAGAREVRTMRDANLALELLLRQFLAELEPGPRSYAVIMEAWRTHFPRRAVWEEALERGLVRLELGLAGAREMQVMLTKAGAALLAHPYAEAPDPVRGAGVASRRN